MEPKAERPRKLVGDSAPKDEGEGTAAFEIQAVWDHASIIVAASKVRPVGNIHICSSGGDEQVEVTGRVWRETQGYPSPGTQELGRLFVRFLVRGGELHKNFGA